MERIFYVPKCADPVVIVNENALRLISLGAKSPSRIVNTSNHAIVSKASIIKDVLQDGKINIDRLASYEVHFGDEEEYLFQLVGCGKCEHCQDKKQLDIVNRCRLESELYDCPAYFFTLTYASEFLPYRGELKYTDVQRFWKRLRMRWTRAGLEHDVRYLVAGEYGRQFGRPHYHVIMWNNPYHCSEMQPALHQKLAVDIFSAWNMCKWSAFDFGQCGDGAAAYAAKYAGKPKEICKHWSKPFIKGSIGNGGIGFPYLAKYMDYYRNNPNCDSIIYTSQFDGCVHEIKFGSYISTHIFPSPARLVDSTKKMLYKQLTDLLTEMVKMQMFSFDDAFFVLETLRPAECIRIKLNRKDCMPYQRSKCWYYQFQYLKVYDKLTTELCEVKEVPDLCRPMPTNQVTQHAPVLYSRMRRAEAEARESL